MPKKVRIKAFDQQTQMMATLTLEQDVSALSQANPGTEAMYSVTYIEIYVPFHYTTGHSADKSWDEIVREEVADASKRGQIVSSNGGNGASSEDASPPPPPPRDEIAAFCDALAFYRETNTSATAQESAHLETIEMLARADEKTLDVHEGLIGDLMTLGPAAAAGYDVEAIEGAMDKVKQWVAKRYQKFQDWRAKRKGKASGGGDDDVDSEMIATEQIGISILDRLKNLRSRAQKTAGLKLMKDGPLTDLLRSQVTQAETLRAAGNNATDNVNYAINIVQEMRRRDIPITPEIADLQTRVNKLSVRPEKSTGFF